MFLPLLASHPRLPVPLVRVLVEHARTHRRQGLLTRALLNNSAICLAELTDLFTPATAADALAHRPGVTVTEVLEVLGKDQSIPTVARLLTTLPDPGGQATRWALGRFQSSSRVAHAALRVQAAPPRVLDEVALRLVSSPSLSAPARHRLGAHARWRMITEPAAGGRLLMVMLAKADREMVGVLMSATAAPPVGTTAWLSDPATTTADVISWAGTSASRLATALRDHPDRSGALAEHALAYPSVRARERMLRLTDLPARLRAVAAKDLVAAGRRDWSFTGPAGPALVRDADPGTVHWFLHERLGDSDALRQAMLRADLDGTTVALLDDRRSRLGVERMARWPHVAQLPSVASEPGWQWWLATYPTTPPALRARAVDYLARTLAGPVTHLERVAAVLDARGRSCEAGLELPVRANSVPETPPVGLVSLVRAALDGQVEQVDSLEHARVLVELAGDFPGTIGDLLVTAATVAR